MSTQLLPLLTAAITALLTGGFTLAGVAITQRNTARREAAAAERDERGRTFEARNRAYTQFLSAADAVRTAAQPPAAARADVLALLVKFNATMADMQLYAPAEVLAWAYTTSNATRRLVDASDGERDSRWATAHDVAFELRQAIRNDLGVLKLTGDPKAIAPLPEE